MKIFISYRRKDSGREVGRIRDRLILEFGAQSVFRDIVDIPAGVDFRTYLDKETNECKVMLVIIGPIWASIADGNGNKRLFDQIDYTRIEVETGLKRLPNDQALVIPVLVGGAEMPAQQEIPESIHQLTYQNGISIHDDPYFDFDMDRLIQSIRTLAPQVLDRQFYEPETVYVPQGPFLMGSAPGAGIPNFEESKGAVDLPAYSIGKYPVTNAQFQEFVRETKMNASLIGWEEPTAPIGKENFPVIRVTWKEALEYCQWLTERTKRKYSLPTEAQWEKACRGGNNCLYPWGNNFDPARCNHGSPKIAAVDAYPAQNNYGFDFVGNVRQWTSTIWGEDPLEPDSAYPYPWTEDGRDALNDNRGFRRVVRGGALQDPIDLLRCSARLSQDPGDRGVPRARCGFRVVMTVSANRR